MFTNINEHIYHTAEKLMNIKLAKKKPKQYGTNLENH